MASWHEADFGYRAYPRRRFYRPGGTMNTNPEDVTQLLGLPEHVRTHPLLRQGYNIGASHRAHGPHPPEEGTRTPRGGSSGPTPFYGVTANGLRDRLVKGARIVRELSAASERDATTETPCCGWRITIPAPEDHEGSGPAFCCKCGALYSAAAAEEALDGYSDEPPKVAVFAVEHVNVAVAHRGGKWERRSHGTAAVSA
jgi:hypothetical protein